MIQHQFRRISLTRYFQSLDLLIEQCFHVVDQCQFPSRKMVAAREKAESCCKDSQIATPLSRSGTVGKSHLLLFNLKADDTLPLTKVHAPDASVLSLARG